MQCPNCESIIPDNSNFCGACGANLSSPPTQPENKKFTFFKGPTDGGKGYAAVMTALMVFPATLCIALDLIFHKNDGWCTYVVGALIVTWIVSVFPVLRLTPAPVTALICLFSVLSYVAYIIGKTGQIYWFYKVGLPLFILAALFISIDAALLGAGKLKGLHALSLVSVEIAVYLIAIEATVDTLLFNMVTIRWSAIAACFFISAVALFEAFQYVIKLMKKNKR
ncbi:MAG: zinc ribbon domain-containing protein [Clostridia bacterium]|nr:zinc ribbon domain-containing protein [Clostridia bacterium]